MYCSLSGSVDCVAESKLELLGRGGNERTGGTCSAAGGVWFEREAQRSRERGSGAGAAGGASREEEGVQRVLYAQRRFRIR